MARRLSRLSFTINQLDQFGEDIVNTDAHLSRYFEEETAASRTRETLSEFFTLLSSDNSLIIKIALVTTNNNRYIRTFFITENKFTIEVERFKRKQIIN